MTKAEKKAAAAAAKAAQDAKNTEPPASASQMAEVPKTEPVTGDGTGAALPPADNTEKTAEGVGADAGKSETSSADTDNSKDPTPTDDPEKEKQDDEKEPEYEPTEEEAAKLQDLRERISADGVVPRGKNEDGEQLFAMIRGDQESTPYTLEGLEAHISAWEKEKAAAEDDEDAPDPEREYIETRIAALCEFYDAANFTIDEEEENGESVIILIDQNGEEIDRGTLSALEGQADLDFIEDQKKPLDPENMKVRWMPFTRRRVLRVIKPFEYEGVEYNPGDVFDWAALGCKPYHISRLYSRRLVRHVEQDKRVVYPFRGIARKPLTSPPDILSPEEKAEATKFETDVKGLSQEDQNQRRAEREKNIAAGKKFTRKNEHLKG